jgi:ligand-binding sensor domain-containing protein
LSLGFLNDYRFKDEKIMTLTKNCSGIFPAFFPVLTFRSWHELAWICVFGIFQFLPSITLAGANEWTGIGPDGGSISALVTDPQTHSTLYAITPAGSLFKSINSGSGWSPINNGLTNAGVLTTVKTLAIDPSNPSTLYAGTYLNGVFKSSNGGGTWSQANTGLATTLVNALTIDPTNPSILYAGTQTGVYKSTDGGGNWSLASTGLTTVDIQALVIGPSALYAATPDGVFKSSDSGGSWILASTGLSSAGVRSLVTDPSALYAGTPDGVYKSADGGGSWTLASTGLTSKDVLAMTIDKANTATLYAGTRNGVFMTINAGESWTPANTGLTVPVLTLAVTPTNPASLYAGTQNGVFKSINAGDKWSQTNTGLAATFVQALAVDPKTPTTFYAGVGGGVFKSINGGGSWTPANTGLTSTSVFDLVIDPSTPTTLYAATDGGVFKSIGGGGSWNSVNIGLTRKYVFDLVINPSSPSTLYAATDGGVFKSTSGGGGWNPVNTGLTNLSVNALAIDLITPATLYAGTNGGGVFKSANSGTNWNPINTGLTNTAVHALAIDPFAPATLYVGTEGGVYKSTNGGVSWTLSNSGLTDMYIRVLALDPYDPSTLYAGTDNRSSFQSGGIFKSSNRGLEWSRFNDGFTTMSVQALAIDPYNPSTLYAGTWGGGIFKFSTLAPVVTIGTPTAITSASATLNGMVVANGLATTAQFEYGLTSAYGSLAPVQVSPNSGSAAQAVSASISGLQPAKTYHYRLTATNSQGTGLVGDAQFQTLKIDQAIVFDTAPSVLVGGTGTVSAKGGASGNPVVFNSQTPSVCTISGGIVSGKTAGYCVIAANQYGNATYNAAPQVTLPFSVGKGNQTLTFGPAPTVILGGTGTISLTHGDSGSPVVIITRTPGVCSVSGSTVTGLTAGICTIDANQAGDANYNPAPQVSLTFSVGKGIQTITFGAAPTLVFGGTGTVSAKGGASGNPVMFSSLTPSVCTTGGPNGSTVTGVGVGICTIASNQAGDANFNPAAQVTQDISVVKLSQTLSFQAAPTVMVGGTGTVSATGGASGNPVVFSSTTTAICTTSGTNGSTVTGNAAGNCTIAANQEGNANYNAAQQVTKTFSVVNGFALTVINSNKTFGTLTSDVGGIACGATCDAKFVDGTLVTLTAIPASNDCQFTGWGGACSGYANTCKLTMDAAQSVSANFAVFNKKRSTSWRKWLLTQ